MFLINTIFSIVSNLFNSGKPCALTSGVKSILNLYLSKSIVTDGKTTRSKVESKKFEELFNMHNPNRLSQHHRNILIVNVTYACPTLYIDEKVVLHERSVLWKLSSRTKSLS